MPPIKILLVEDESIAALYTQKCLTILGYTVPAIVASGLEALHKVKEMAPDLVLMDIMLAGNMDGIETAQQIYDQFQTPVIYLTSYQDEAVLERAIITKPYGYLLKPFNLSELRVAIETAINKYQQEKAEQSRFDELTRLNRLLEQEVAERKRAEEALRDSDRRWRSLVENAGSYILIIDRDGRIQFVNHSEDSPLFANLVGRHIYDVVDPDYHQSAQEAITTVFKTGESAIFIASSTPESSPSMWFENRLGPIKKEGEVVAVTIVASDITAQREIHEVLRKSEERLQYAQKVGHVGSWEYDILTDQFWGSDEAKRIYGFPPDGPPLSPEDVESRIPERERVHQALIDLVEHDQEYNLEFEIRPEGKPGKTIISSVAMLMRNDRGEPIRVIGVIQDITARKLAEEKVHRLNEELELRVAKRTAQLKEVQEQLVRQEKLAILGQLAGGVSHELRNPLGVLSNAVYFLKIVLADADEMVTEYLNIISAEIRKSEKIVSDLLSFSRQREAIREQVSLAALAENELTAMSPPPQRVIFRNQLQYDLPPVIIDPQQIGQVLTNLVTNACQAMTDGGTLTLSAVDEGSMLALSVADTGPGIPPETLSKVFEPLFTTKARGIGLGLAVSKQLVEVNEGTISVVSQPGHGCEFIVRLPIARTPE